MTVRCGEHLLEMTEEQYWLRIRQCPVCLPNPIWMQTPQEPRAPAAPAMRAEELLRRANRKEDEPAVPVTVVEEAPAEAAPRVFPGEFRPVPLPADAPKFLSRMLRRLDVRVRRGELPESSEALRDALDYVLRYWAGVCWACAKQAGKVSDAEAKLGSETLSSHECEKLSTRH